MLRLGTRASALATTQSAWVARQLVPGGEGAANGFSLVHISTHGDRDRTSPLTQIGGTGVFVSAVREALLAGEVSVVVHSLKDLPTAPPAGIMLAAVPVREDPSDALITRPGLAGLATIPEGGTVGTGSPRRAAQLRILRPDLEVRSIRGNIDTRLRYAESGELDAVVLATAGLMRLGLEDRIAERFCPREFLPAPAQGALAVEVREGFMESTDGVSAESGAGDPGVDVHGAEGLGVDTDIARALRELDHIPTRAAAASERALLQTLEAGCSAPVAAYAEMGDDGLLTLKAGVYGRSDHIIQEASVAVGSDLAKAEVAAVAAVTAVAAELGRVLAARMLTAGARTLLAEER